MANWTFEPGHTAAEFSVRHMMVTNVRGHFKNVQGILVFDPKDPGNIQVEVTINTNEIWSGEAGRDDHLRAADFLAVEQYPKITFNEIKVIGDHDYQVTGDLTIRDVTKKVSLEVSYLGQWPTPWWEDGEDKGPKTRAGFLAKTTINRHDFGVSWNAPLDNQGVVVGDLVDITIDAEAILET
ncbi:MAG: YceI family protein [Cyclobacteriaceae bacterium]